MISCFAAPRSRVVKQRGTPATVVDVQTVAVEELKTPSAIERQQTEMIQKFEGINRGLRVGLAFDTLTPRFRRWLVVVLSEIAKTVGALMASLRDPAVEERSPKEDETR